MHRSYTFRPAPQDFPSQNIGSPHTLGGLRKGLASQGGDLGVSGEGGEGGVDQLAAPERLGRVTPFRQRLAKCEHAPSNIGRSLKCVDI